jgi:hypothetical protein
MYIPESTRPLASFNNVFTSIDVFFEYVSEVHTY